MITFTCLYLVYIKILNNRLYLQIHISVPAIDNLATVTSGDTTWAISWIKIDNCEMAAEVKVEWAEVSRSLARSSSRVQPRSGPVYTSDTFYVITGLTACLTQYSVTVSPVDENQLDIGTSATMTFASENTGKAYAQ